MGAATGLVYLARPAARFNFDGVACAIAVELGEARYLVHGNHVAYGALGWLAHHAAAAAGYSGPALMTLQVLSSLLGAAGVAGFCAMLLRLGFAAPLAAAAAAGLAVSRLYWTWSLEAQVYPLGCAFLLWAAAELAGDRPRPVLVGLLQAGAVLGHVGHAMFTVPALALLPDRRSRRRYLWALCAATGAAYLVAIVFFVHPRTLDELRIWLLGSAALPVDRSFEWHGGYSLGALVDWVRVKLEFMSGGAAAGAAAWGLALWGAALAWSRRPRAAKLAVFWICSYAILYLRWQPYIVVYHYSDVPVLWLLLACAADAAGPRVGAAGGEGRIGPRARGGRRLPRRVPRRLELDD
ncbi:MAG: hypothetical protein NTX64_10850, partial [Elusimicrobia bacterium]|nr:hypothetical protein [Elusimicrobiota bacterium]